MRRFLAMMRYSKKLLILTICLLVELCIILGICIFDVVQLIQVLKNTVLLSPAFVVLNIVLIGLLVINVAVLIISIVYRRVKEKEREFEED